MFTATMILYSRSVAIALSVVPENQREQVFMKMSAAVWEMACEAKDSVDETIAKEDSRRLIERVMKDSKGVK